MPPYIHWEMILKRPYCLPVVIAAVLLLSLPAARPALAQAGPDPRLDSVARLLAGLPPTRPEHAALANTASWKEHSRALQESWARVRDGQRAAMVAWRATELPAGCPVGQTLFYPFSGPDFLNAHWLFPDCANRVMFGLERIGVVPAVEEMTEKEFAQLLANVRSFMINLFARNYFVTDTMLKDLRTEQRLQGVVPVFMVLMALSGVEVLRVAPLALERAPGAKPARPGGRGIRGITIDYRVPGPSPERRLNYFSLDATDAALADYPEFLDYLRAMGPTTTLIKSASYLLHGNEFNRVRGIVLDQTRFLVQDDTGLQYTRLIKRGFEVRVYGSYGVPIPPFEGAFQSALAAAYQKQNPPLLPFRFGYHRNRGDVRSTLMVARLPADRVQTAPAPR
jgi:hypothetical protein